MTPITETLQVLAVAKVLTPLCHASGNSGNEAILCREEIVTPYGRIAVPALSGNALRHRLVREPGMLWLIHSYDWLRLTKREADFLLHGGTLQQGGSFDARLAYEIEESIPLLRLLGGALPKQMLAGTLQVWRGMLLCRENSDRLRSILPELGSFTWRPAEDFVSVYQYTRNDPRQRFVELIDDPLLDEGDTCQMLYSGQAVLPGAGFFFGFVLQNPRLVDYGALLWSLECWAQQGGTFGGKTSIGHGKLDLYLLLPEGLPSPEEAIQAYTDYALERKERATALLKRMFPGDSGKRKVRKEAAN